MISLTFPDGSTRDFKPGVTGREVAESIGPGLAKAALAGKVDGKLVDTQYRIDRDAAAFLDEQRRALPGDRTLGGGVGGGRGFRQERSRGRPVGSFGGKHPVSG